MSGQATRKTTNSIETADLLQEYANWDSPSYPHAEFLQAYFEYPSKNLWLQACYQAVKDENREWLENPPLNLLYSRLDDPERKKTARFISNCALKALLIRQTTEPYSASEMDFQDIEKLKDAHASDDSVKDLIQYFVSGQRPSEGEKATVKVLLAGNEGKLGQLEIEKIPNGEGKIFSDPAFMSFSRYEPDFEESIRIALQYVTSSEGIEEAKNYNYRWRLFNRSNAKKEDNNFCVLDKQLRGSSMGFASALAFLQLFDRVNIPLGGQFAFTGKIDENGVLQSVGEYPDKLQAGKNFTIYFPDADREQIKHYREDGYSIEGAVTVRYAIADIKLKNRTKKAKTVLGFAGVIIGILLLATLAYAWRASLLSAENERQQKELYSQKLELAEQMKDVAQKNSEADNQKRLNAENEQQLAKERENLAKEQSKILAQKNEQLAEKNIQLDEKNVQLDTAKQVAEKNEKEAKFQKGVAERNKKISDAYKQIAHSYNYFLEGEKALQENDGTLAKQSFANAIFRFDNYDFRFNFLRALFESNSVENTWDHKTGFQGMEIPFFGGSRNFYSAASSNKAGIVAIGGQERVEIFNQENGGRVVSISGKGSVSSLAFSEKHNLLFATWIADEHSTFTITNLNSSKFETKPYEIQDCTPNALAISEQRNLLIVACVDKDSDDSLTGKIIASDLIDIKFTTLNTKKNNVFDQILFDKNNNLITKVISSNDWASFPEGIEISVFKNGKLYANNNGWIAGINSKNAPVLTGLGIDSYDENGKNTTKDKVRELFLRGNVSQSGKLLVTSDLNRTISVWKLEDMSQLLTVQSNEPLSQVIFTSENSFLSITVSGEVKNYKFAVPETIKSDDEIFSLSFSEDDKQMAVTEPGGYINFYDRQTLNKIRAFNPLNFDFAQFGVTKQQIIDRHTPYSENPQISWSENVVFSGAIGDWIVLADVDTNSPKLKLKKEGDISASLISKDGKLFAVAEELSDKNSLIRVWNTESNEEIFNIANDKPSEEDEHNNVIITALAFSPNSKLIALGYADSYFEVWDVKEEKLLWSNFLERPHRITNLAFSFDNTYLAASTIFSTVGLWKFYPETFSTTVKKVQLVSPISQLEFFPDDNILALAIPFQKRIFVWDYVNSAKAIGINKDRNFLGFAFSKDGSTMAYFDDENEIYFWKTREIKDSLRLDNQQYLSFISSYSQDFPSYLPNEELKSGLGISDTREMTYGELKYREDQNAAEKNNENRNAPSSSSNFEFGKTTDINTFDCYSALKPPDKAELNTRFPLTFTSPAEPCAIYPALDVRRKDGAYSKDENDWKDGIRVAKNEEFYGLIYITNTAPNNLSDPKYIAENVRVKVEADDTVGAEHWIKVTFVGDNTNEITEFVRVFTGPNDYIELVPNSGIVTDYQAKNVLKKNIPMGKETFVVGNIAPGFSTDRFIRFSVKVKQKP